MLKFIAALFARRPRPEPEDLQLELTIETAIEMSQEKNEYVSISFRNGNVYAYPYGFGGTAWGVNGGKYGFSIIQGIRGGPEGNKRWINRDM
jgi:hypothetical protein